MNVPVLLVLLGSFPVAEIPVRLEARGQEGRPVAGAVVELGSTPVGVTDEEGRLAFSLPLGRETPVRLLAPGGWWARGSLFAAAETEALVVIPLEPPRPVSGRVIDGATGEGIADARVWVDAGPGAAGRTDRLGEYSLAVPFAPAILYLRAEAPGYGDTVVAMGTAEKVPDTLVLRRVRGVAGRVVDAVGRPVPEAEVRLISWASNPEGRPQATAPVDARTDAGGEFRADRLPLGEIHLFVTAKGFLPAAKEAIQRMAGKGPADLGTVVLEDAVALTGVATDPQGHPLAGIEVRRGGAQTRATTGSNGAFRLDGLRAGESVSLHFTGKGYVPASLSGLTVPTEPVEVVLRRAARIAGTVVDEAGDPIPGATLFVTREDGGLSGSARSDAAGRFTVEDVEPGTLRISAVAPGFLPTAVAAKAEEVEIVLSRGAVVEGVITAAEDAPAAGAKVRVSDNGGQGLLSGLGLPEAVADEAGRYRLEGVEEGARSIRAEWPGLPPTVAEVHVRPGTNPLDLRLQGGFEVSGRVTTSRGDPIAGAELTLSPLRETAVSGADGSFRFAAVPDGRYRLQGSRLGHTGSPREIRVAGAAVRDADLRLDRGGSLAGRITGLDPGILPQVEVRASSTLSRWDQVVRARPDGTYRLDDLGPGVWSVLAQIPQTSRSARGTVTIVPGQEGTLDLAFGAGLTLSGWVENDGQPLQRAWVTVQNGPTSGSALTGEDGRFRIEGLPPGPYAVIVVHPPSGLQSSHQMDLDRSREISLTVAARPPGR